MNRALLSAVLALPLGCTPSITGTPPDGTGGNGPTLPGGSGQGGNGGPSLGPSLGSPNDARPAASGDGGPSLADFHRTENGGYKLGGPVSGEPAAAGMVNEIQGCTTIVGVVRDFKGLAEYPAHPDFETYQ